MSVQVCRGVIALYEAFYTTVRSVTTTKRCGRVFRARRGQGHRLGAFDIDGFEKGSAVAVHHRCFSRTRTPLGIRESATVTDPDRVYR